MTSYLLALVIAFHGPCVPKATTTYVDTFKRDPHGYSYTVVRWPRGCRVPE